MTSATGRWQLSIQNRLVDRFHSAALWHCQRPGMLQIAAPFVRMRHRAEGMATYSCKGPKVDNGDAEKEPTSGRCSCLIFTAAGCSSWSSVVMGSCVVSKWAKPLSRRKIRLPTLTCHVIAHYTANQSLALVSSASLNYPRTAEFISTAGSFGYSIDYA